MVVHFSISWLVNMRGNGKRKLRPRQADRTTVQKKAKQNERNGSTTRKLFDDADSGDGDRDDRGDSESSAEEDGDDEEYEVEEVIDEEDGGKILVKWVGYPDASWEPKAQIPKHYYNQFLKKKQASSAKISKPGSIPASTTTKPSARKKPAAASNICVLCNDEEKGGRLCVSCKKPVHHMCSNELITNLGVKETLDACYCSEKCYVAVTTSAKNDMSFVEATRAAENMASPGEEAKLAAKAATKVSKSDLNSPPDSVVKKKQPGSVDHNSVVGKNIAFTPSAESWLSPKVYKDVGSLFLAGVVTRQRKNGNGQPIPDQFEIRWTPSQYQTKTHQHVISQAKAEEGIVNYECMIKRRIATESWDVLRKPFEEANHTNNLWDEFEEVDGTMARFETSNPIATDLEEVEKMKSMDFRADATLEAPTDLFSHSDGSTETRLKEDKKEIFQHSATSSFFAFLPLCFWRTTVENTNAYAAVMKQPLVTLDELMTFLGILFFISTVDKGEYSNYWGDQVENKMFDDVSVGLERVMNLKRFKFIRKNLCFHEGVSPAMLQADPAARIRPLINMLKLRAPSVVELGRNVAVDEASVACRSKFGRHMIVYNSSKPTGKYHFKLYMCCCSTTWFALNFKVHCASGIGERLGGIISKEDIAAHKAATAKSVETRKHVIEVTMPIHKSMRIVNTDNYYTSCHLLESLKVVGLYCRGTIRENSKFGPKCFMLSKADKLVRGSIRQGVEVKHKIVGASWADGAMVNILSNADDSSISTVTRLVGRNKTTFSAPTCIREYNQGMQGVDRLDQLRSRFSIADGHTFQKWHNKLAMAIIDIARCNAYICRKMSGAVLHPRDPHRQFMVDLSSELLSDTWKSSLGDVGLFFSSPMEPRSQVTPTSISPRSALTSNTRPCTLKNSKQVFPAGRAKRECVVCRFEGRYPSEQTVFCFEHSVSLCTSVHSTTLSSPLLPYHCPDSDATCLVKFHTFYFPAGLFNTSGNIRRSCALFKAKKQATAKSRVPQLATVNEDLSASYSPASRSEIDHSIHPHSID